MEPTIVISIISLCISTIIGIWNIYIQVQSKKKEEKRLQFEQRKKDFDARPKFEVVSFTNNFNDSQVQSSTECDLEVLNLYFTYEKGSFFYDERYKDITKWVSTTFEFKNIGLTEINVTTISTNLPKSMSLFKVYDGKCSRLVNAHLLNYSALYDRPIKPGETFTLKVNYLEGQTVNDCIVASLTIWMQDVYGKIWAQPLFVTEGKIYDSKEESWDTFKNLTQTDVAEKCFAGILPW